MAKGDRNMKVGQLVVVYWVDSCTPSEQSWMDPDDIQADVCGIETVGWVSRIDSQSVTVVHSVDTTTGNICGAMTVPLVAITGVTRLG